MSEEPKILASISGGKDSLAALITHIESGGRCDGAVYCRIMFDDETSAEYPEHEDFLFNKCFPTLEREYGVKTTIVQQSYTYVERFHKIITRNTKNKGRIYGFPFIRGSWCNSDLKLHPLRKFKKRDRGVYRNCRHSRRRNGAGREKDRYGKDTPSRRAWNYGGGGF